MQPSYQRCLLLAMIFLSVTGCVFVPSEQKPPSESQLLQMAISATERNDYEEAARRYAQLADVTSDLKRPMYLLHAASALLQENHIEAAQKVLGRVDTGKLDATQTLRAKIIGARIALAQDRPAEAIQSLQIGASPDASLRAEARELRARAYQRAGDQLSAAQELVLREGDLDRGDVKTIQANRQAIWQILTARPTDELRRGIKSPPDALSGWCELAIIARTPSATGNLETAIAAWRSKYPSHPASREIVDLVIARRKEEIARPRHIAVLLPQTGPMAAIGAALRDGFLAAHFHRDNPAYSPVIRFYDTGDGTNASARYAEAVDNGSDFIVGPLTKDALTEIARGRITVPTLALNRTDAGNGRDLLYEFGLAPEDEARQVAQRAWSDGHSRALALVPEGEWGRRVLAAFEAQWEALGGVLLESATYPAEGSDFSDPIKRLLNIDESEQRRVALEKLIQQPLQFEPRRRQDADVIFMVAYPREARLIRPQLKFNYAGRLPIYSTSHVFSGKRDPDADRDVDDVIFCDIPWLFTDSPIKADVKRLWPEEADRYARFYAMGADAYNVIPVLKGLKGSPYEIYNGQTGALQMDGGNRLIRQLQFARFTNGIPRLLN
jgi:outer membrane PBP1 activator LpoA protein